MLLALACKPEKKYHDEVKPNAPLTPSNAIADVLIFQKELNDVDIIIPVPLHPKKGQQRGFKQSRLLCNSISEILEKPLYIV